MSLLDLIQTDADLAADEFANTVTHAGVSVKAVITPITDEFDMGDMGPGFVKTSNLLALCQKDRFTSGVPTTSTRVVVTSEVAGVTSVAYHVESVEEYTGMIQLTLKRVKHLDQDNGFA